MRQQRYGHRIATSGTGLTKQAWIERLILNLKLFTFQ